MLGPGRLGGARRSRASCTSRPSSRPAGGPGRRGGGRPPAESPLAGGSAGLAGSLAAREVGEQRRSPSRRPLDRAADERPELDLGDARGRALAGLPLADVAELERGAEELDLVGVLDGSGPCEGGGGVDGQDDLREGGRKRAGLGRQAAALGSRREGASRPEDGLERLGREARVGGDLAAELARRGLVVGADHEHRRLPGGEDGERGRANGLGPLSTSAAKPVSHVTVAGSAARTPSAPSSSAMASARSCRGLIPA